MIKRIIIFIGVAIISIIIICLLIGNIGANYIHEVTFKTSKSGLAVEIYGSDKNKIGSFNSAEYKMSLKDGDYYYAIKTIGYIDTKTNFKMAGEAKVVNIKAIHTPNYLSEQYEDQKDEILAVINSTYKSTIKNYDILSGQLFGEGDWFGAIIKRKIDSRDATDLYRIIMHKEDNKWVMVHYPEIVITKTSFPSVPSDVVEAVNNLSDL